MHFHGMLVGFAHLEHLYQIDLVQPLRIRSSIGSSRLQQESPSGTHKQYPASYRPEDDFAGHFAFGLKYEEMHLEFLARLFATTGPKPLEAWSRKEPNGQYARRAGFLYEWLIQERLDVPDLTQGNYIDLLAPDAYLTRPTPLRNRRWRIKDNLPGTPGFCPLVRRTTELQSALEFDPRKALEDLDQRFGHEILMGSSSWLMLKESRASFQIEHEENRSDRIQRFASVIARFCGKIESPLSEPSLQALQVGILGKDAPGLGLRKSPVFVGQATLQQDIVHYIAPHHENVPSLLEGLATFEEATRGTESILRAAVVAFAFVYIHPLRDGNGRIHRILINDTLLRDQAIADAIILPVSASITHSVRLRADYERALERFSGPFMARFADRYRFGEITVAPDGTRTNFVFDAYQDALPAWKYPDLTEQALYVSRLIQHTITVQMADEATILGYFRTALERLKDVLEMPDPDANRIIRSLKENGWQVTGRLGKEYPFLEDPELRKRFISAVRGAFEPETSED